MRTRVIRNTIAYMLAGFAPAFVGFVTLPVYSRFMSPGDYGIVSLISALANILLCFGGLQLGTTLQRFYFDYDHEGVKEFFTTTVAGMLAVNAILFLPLLLWGEPLAGIVFPSADIPYNPFVRMALIIGFLGTFPPHFIWLLKITEKGRKVLYASLANVVVNVGLGMLFVVWRGMGAHGFLLAQAISYAAYNLVLIGLCRRWFKPAFKPAMLREGLGYSLPMIPHTLGAIMFMACDKLILGYYVPVAVIGLYGIAERLAFLFMMLIRAFNEADTPAFMKLSKQSKKEAVAKYRLIMAKWSVLAALCYMGLALFSQEFIELLLPAVYHDAFRFVPVLLIAIIFRGMYLFAMRTIIFEKKTASIPIVTGLAGLLNIGLNLALIPRFGAIAAAWATVAASAVYFLVALLFSRRYYALSYDIPAFLRSFGLAAAIVPVALALTGGNVMVNAAMKTLFILTGITVLLIWNDGDVRGDIKECWKVFTDWGRRRAGGRTV